MDDAGADEVRLRVPARPEYGRLARVAAAGLAVRMGFSYREVEDLRLAVDEVVISLLDGRAVGGAELALRLEPAGDTLVIDAELRGGGREPAQPTAAARERLLALVQPLVTSVRADEGSGRVRVAVQRHR